jgi:hypothetical protein
VSGQFVYVVIWSAHGDVEVVAVATTRAVAASIVERNPEEYRVELFYLVDSLASSWKPPKEGGS